MTNKEFRESLKEDHYLESTPFGLEEMLLNKELKKLEKLNDKGEQKEKKQTIFVYKNPTICKVGFFM